MSRIGDRAGRPLRRQLKLIWLQSDISRFEAKVERLEAQLAAKDRELASLTGKAKAASAFKAQIEKLQQERDEFQRMVIGNQQVRTQQIHESKKKEKEYIKLQEPLTHVPNPAPSSASSSSDPRTPRAKQSQQSRLVLSHHI